MHLAIPRPRALRGPRPRTVLAFAAALVAGLAVGGLLVAVIATRFLGYHILAVESDSMAPALRRGDLIVTRPVPITEANVGDTVLYDEGTQVHLLVAHRVISVVNLNTNIHDSRTGKTTTEHTRLLRTQGDANPQPDGQVVDASRFRGVLWFYVPHVGAVLGAWNFQQTLLAIAALTALAWVAYEVRSLWRRRRAARG